MVSIIVSFASSVSFASPVSFVSTVLFVSLYSKSPVSWHRWILASPALCFHLHVSLYRICTAMWYHVHGCSWCICIYYHVVLQRVQFHHILKQNKTYAWFQQAKACARGYHKWLRAFLSLYGCIFYIVGRSVLHVAWILMLGGIFCRCMVCMVVFSLLLVGLYSCISFTSLIRYWTIVGCLVCTSECMGLSYMV